MNQYVTGAIIKQLREGKGMTQAQLAARLQVSDKAVSRWETAKGYPDITLIEPLAQALDISVMELLSGDWVTNANRAGNLLRSKWYVCPICGNILHSTGAAVSCPTGTTPSPWSRWRTNTTSPWTTPWRRAISSPSWPGCLTKASSWSSSIPRGAGPLG